MHVEIDMFSGLPNPTWSLTPDEAASLSDCLKAGTFAPGAATPVEGGDLGFREFRVSALPAPVGYPSVVVTTDAVIAATASGTRAILGCDDAFGLLRDSAAAHLEPEALQGIPEE